MPGLTATNVLIEYCLEGSNELTLSSQCSICSCIYQDMQIIIAVSKINSKRFLMKFVLSIMQSIDYCRVSKVCGLLIISFSKRTIGLP